MSRLLGDRFVTVVRGPGRAALVAGLVCLAASAVCAQSTAGPRETGSAGGQPSVTATVEPAVATVGDRLLLRIVLERPGELDVAFPDVAAAADPLEVLDVRIAPESASDGRVIEIRDYVLAAFETGPLGVSPMRFLYVDAGGDTASILCDSLSVLIESVLPEVREHEEVGPKDIKPPMELPRRIWPYVVAVLVVLAVVAAGCLLRRWLRTRGRDAVERAPAEPAVPRRAAHVVAMERLERLAREDLIRRGEIPLFYVRVTEIVRLYLRDRFGVDAIDMTTSELGPAMREVHMEDDDISWAVSYMLHADLAKFAKHVPGEERARSDLSAAGDFVERTRFRDGRDEGELLEGDAGDHEGVEDGGGEEATR